MSPPTFYIGVDVGTDSARACLINESGDIIALESKPISRWEPLPGFWNQSTTDIWASICYCVNHIISQALAQPDSGLRDRSQVKGIGFDATCSLVVLDEKTDKPVSVGPHYNPDGTVRDDQKEQNIILWMDHRAVTQTDEINATGQSLLKFVGGKMSIEMEIPKAKWLKENMPAGLFEQCKFYDLGDFLTHKATGSEARSFNSIVAKQGYVPVGIEDSKYGWSADFLNKIGLPELAEDNFRRLGGVNGVNGTILSAGALVSNLTADAAHELGLTTECAVGSGVIDAYAGWIGTVAAKFDSDEQEQTPVSQRLAAVAGTSTCHLVMSDDPVFVPGVWGPYRDVIFPGKWMAEGGQSCTGELLHHVITTHPAYQDVQKLADAAKLNIFDWLNDHLAEMAKAAGSPSIPHLTRHFFFYGDLHGNRSPIADPRMKGSVIGLDMNTGVDQLAIAYYGAVEFIGQQTRHIIDSLNKAGHNVSQVYLSGGQCRNGLLTQIMATCTGMTVFIPKYIDAAVVHGSAMLGAKAAAEAEIKQKGDKPVPNNTDAEAPQKAKNNLLYEIMQKMTHPGKSVVPDTGKDSVDVKILNTKYQIFLEMAEFQQKARALVDKAIA